jgi:hypothetical protein
MLRPASSLTNAPLRSRSADTSLSTPNESQFVVIQTPQKFLRHFHVLETHEPRQLTGRRLSRTEWSFNTADTLKVILGKPTCVWCTHLPANL